MARAAGWEVREPWRVAFDYRDGHTPSFQARLCELVGVAFGKNVAHEFQDAYRDAVDEVWRR